MLVGKQVADLLTIIRALLGFALALLGILVGEAGLLWAVWMLILSWTTDCLDGLVARRSRLHYQSWWGEHDLEIDMAVSAGLLLFLMISGYVSTWMAGVYILVWTVVFWRMGIPRSLGMLFQAPLYGWFIWIALNQEPYHGRWLLVWIVAAVALTWPKFPQQVIPGFLTGMKEAWIHLHRGEM